MISFLHFSDYYHEASISLPLHWFRHYAIFDIFTLAHYAASFLRLIIDFFHFSCWFSPSYCRSYHFEVLLLFDITYCCISIYFSLLHFAWRFLFLRLIASAAQLSLSPWFLLSLLPIGFIFDDILRHIFFISLHYMLSCLSHYRRRLISFLILFAFFDIYFFFRHLLFPLILPWCHILSLPLYIICYVIFLMDIFIGFSSLSLRFQILIFSIVTFCFFRHIDASMALALLDFQLFHYFHFLLLSFRDIFFFFRQYLHCFYYAIWYISFFFFHADYWFSLRLLIDIFASIFIFRYAFLIYFADFAIFSFLFCFFRYT